jgi:mannose-6-phosphate isomerase-like protein (cupin superfamily)
MAIPIEDAFELGRKYVHLMEGGIAKPVEADFDFWDTIDGRRDLQHGRLVSATELIDDSTHWEMHSGGDQVLILLAGAVEVVLQDGLEEEAVEMRSRTAYIVPRGLWHRFIVRRPGVMVFIRPGPGIERRPV